MHVEKQLLWFCFASLCDWLKNSAPFSQTIRIKPNRDLFAFIFCVKCQPHAFALSCDWFIGLSAAVEIGQSN